MGGFTESANRKANYKYGSICLVLRDLVDEYLE